jgi:hypothetical protein
MPDASTTPKWRQTLSAGWQGLRDGRAGNPLVGSPDGEPGQPERLLGPGEGLQVSTGYVDMVIAWAATAQAELARDLHRETVDLQARLLSAAHQVLLAHERVEAGDRDDAKTPLPDGPRVSQADVAGARRHRAMEQERDRYRAEFRATGERFLELLAQWSAEFDKRRTAAEAQVHRANQLIGHYRTRVMRYHRKRDVVATWQPPAPQLIAMWSGGPLAGLAIAADADAVAIINVALRLFDLVS